MNEPPETVPGVVPEVASTDVPQSEPRPVSAASPPVIRSSTPKSEQRAEKHPMLAVLLYLSLVFLGGALVAPRLYATLQFLAEGHPIFRDLAEQPFHRYVGRCLILLALLGLPAFLKALRIPSIGALGLRFRARDTALAAEGVAWGIAALTGATALAIAFGARRWDIPHAGISRLLWASALAAIVVAVLEEILFRGALFGSLRRRSSFAVAALLSSGFYALVHFFEHPTSPEVVYWFSGLQTLGQMLQGFARLDTLIPGFLNIALIGFILALALEKTGSLAFSIGLHASIIFFVKVLGALTATMPQANTWAWGGNKLVDGWAPGLLLVALYFVLRKTLPNCARGDA